MPPIPESETKATSVANQITMSTPSATTLISDATSVHIAHPLGEHSVQISNFWLRDHCRCTECYNPDTFQRKHNVLDIPIDIRPLRLAITLTSTDEINRSRYSLSAKEVLRVMCKLLYACKLERSTSANVKSRTFCRARWARVCLWCHRTPQPFFTTRCGWCQVVGRIANVAHPLEGVGH